MKYKLRRTKGRVLFAGQSYYHCWYLSRALRKLGWKADVLNWDYNSSNYIYYHGEDFKFKFRGGRKDLILNFLFFIKAIFKYDIFHFSNAHGMQFGFNINYLVKRLGLQPHDEIRILKKLGKIIVYSNNGCTDGSSQASFRELGPPIACDDCKWNTRPDICSEELNLGWGKVRNELADYQCTNWGYRLDYNESPKVHQVPEFYCLDANFWRPDLEVPPEHVVQLAPGTVKLYHAVGDFESRSENNKNIKSTHIYLPLVERLKREGYPVELILCKDVPNKMVRFYQVQADIVLEMLTVGFFGANAREALMLGKPVVCFLRPEWLEEMRKEIPEYVDELPVINATSETVYDVVKYLVENPEKRKEIGCRGREFALKWHSAEAGARRLDRIYSKLIEQVRGKK